MSRPFVVKFRLFKRLSLEVIWCIRLKFSAITNTALVCHNIRRHKCISLIREWYEYVYFSRQKCKIIVV